MDTIRKVVILIVVLAISCMLAGNNRDRQTRRTLMSPGELEVFDNQQAGYGHTLPHLGYRNTLPPSNLTHEIIDNVNVLLEWQEPMDLIKISYHDNVLWDAYVQFSDEGYGTVFDLSDYPDHDLEYLEFHHQSWDLDGNWEYDILMIDWDTGNLLSSRTDTTRIQDGWEKEVPLGSVEATSRVGVFIVPQGHQANDAYPVLDFDGEMLGESMVINADDYSMVQYADGDFIMDLYIRPSSRGGETALRKAPKMRVSQRDDRAEQRNRNLLGYNVYRDENLVAHIDNPDSTSYLDRDLEDNTYEYYVTAVYDEDRESDPSNIVEVRIIAELEVIFFEDFSDYPDFVTSFPPWTTVDIDSSFTHHFRRFEFPNEGNPMAWMVFNPYNTDPPMVDDGSLVPHSGEKVAASFSASGGVSDKWLISPQISLGNHSSLKFYAQSHTHEYGLERLKVGISVTDTDTGSFQFIFPEEEPYHEPLPFVWEEINVDLSFYDDQDIYIAFQAVSDDALALYLDSITVLSEGRVSVDHRDTPAADRLTGNYPNPFNPETTIFFHLQQDSQVSLEIYNIRGQKINTLTDSFKNAGEHRVVWNGKDFANREVPSGVYHYRITTDYGTQTGKMMMIK